MVINRFVFKLLSLCVLVLFMINLAMGSSGEESGYFIIYSPADESRQACFQRVVDNFRTDAEAEYIYTVLVDSGCSTAKQLMPDDIDRPIDSSLIKVVIKYEDGDQLTLQNIPYLMKEQALSWMMVQGQVGEIYRVTGFELTVDHTPPAMTLVTHYQER